MITSAFYGYLGWVVDNCDDPATMSLIPGDFLDSDLPLAAQWASIIFAPWEVPQEEWSSVVHGDLAVSDYILDLEPRGPMGTAGGDTHMRMREGIERFMITDINNPAGSAMAQSTLPASWDYVAGNLASRPFNVQANFNHLPGGSNVLYMDGHVEFQKYPGGKFPANAPTALAHTL